MTRIGAVCAGVVLLAGCSGPASSSAEAPPEDAPVEGGEARFVEASDGPVHWKIAVAPEHPRVGDVLRVRLDVSAKSEVSVTMPPFGEALGQFSIVDFSEGEALEGSEMRRWQRYQVQAPLSGRHRLPQLRILVGTGDGAREVLTDEVPVEVRSVVAEGEERLRPPKGALPNPRLRRWLWRYGGLLLGLGLLLTAGAWAFRRYGRSGRRPTGDPFAEAIAALAELRASGLPDEGARDQWYVRLSNIVRRYIEDRFHIRAPERTTEEFLVEARRAPELSGSHSASLGAFLSLCDRVKFAGYVPTEDESAAVLSQAEAFVRATQPRSEEPAS